MPLGLMAVPTCVVGASAAVGMLALVGAVFALRWGGWMGWTLGVVAALIAVAGLGFLGFGMWGRFAGYPWAFGS